MLETWWSWTPNIFRSSRKLMQSWCYYKNIFKFFNYTLNGIKSLDIMEVYTTNDFAYNGNIYHPELDLKEPKECLSYTQIM